MQEAALEKLVDYGCEYTALTEEEFNAFRSIAKEQVWPEIAQDIGEDYFNEIVAEVEAIEARLAK